MKRQRPPTKYSKLNSNLLDAEILVRIKKLKAILLEELLKYSSELKKLTG